MDVSLYRCLYLAKGAYRYVKKNGGSLLLLLFCFGDTFDNLVLILNKH
jgi:hypothetical protein